MRPRRVLGEDLSFLALLSFSTESSLKNSQSVDQFASKETELPGDL